MEERSPATDDNAQVVSVTPESPAPSGPQYEFNETQNKVMEELDWKLHVTGLFIIVATLGVAAFFIGQLVKGAFPFWQWSTLWWIGGIFLGFAHGGWLINAGNAFEKIHKTRGKDIDHLMEALGNMSNFFTMMAVAATLTFLISFVRFVISFFV